MNASHLKKWCCNVGFDVPYHGLSVVDSSVLGLLYAMCPKCLVLQCSNTRGRRWRNRL